MYSSDPFPMGNSNTMPKMKKPQSYRTYSDQYSAPTLSGGAPLLMEERNYTDVESYGRRYASCSRSSSDFWEADRRPSSPPSWVLPYVTDNLRRHYKLRKELRRGSSGVIRICIRKGTNERFACKTISKLYLPESGMMDILREVEAMKKLSDHENVVKLKEVFEDRRNIHLVMELCEGGDLSDIIFRSIHGIPEFDAVPIFKQVVQAVKFCHENEVFHRDLKPENIFLHHPTIHGDYPSGKMMLKLGDFGVSMRLKKGDVTTGTKGTMYFLAPEMLTGEGTYGLEADIWSLGVVLYVLLMGRHPFKGDSPTQTYYLICHSEADFVHPRSGSRLSFQAEHLLRRMLSKDPKQRATLDEILSAPWLTRRPSPKPSAFPR